MPHGDKNFGGSLVLDFRKWWRHVKTIYTIFPQNELLLCVNILSRSLGLIVSGINFVRFLFAIKTRLYEGGNFAKLECIEMDIELKKILRRFSKFNCNVKEIIWRIMLRAAALGDLWKNASI